MRYQVDTPHEVHQCFDKCFAAHVERHLSSHAVTVLLDPLDLALTDMDVTTSTSRIQHTLAPQILLNSNTSSVDKHYVVE